jgi:hypothetical protein
MQHLLRNGTKDLPRMSKILASERVGLFSPALCKVTFSELIRIFDGRFSSSSTKGPSNDTNPS